VERPVREITKTGGILIESAAEVPQKAPTETLTDGHLPPLAWLESLSRD
jgi:hypothetical protein